jgi:hypothetical protein
VQRRELEGYGSTSLISTKIGSGSRTARPDERPCGSGSSWEQSTGCQVRCRVDVGLMELVNSGGLAGITKLHANQNGTGLTNE